MEHSTHIQTTSKKASDDKQPRNESDEREGEKEGTYQESWGACRKEETLERKRGYELGRIEGRQDARWGRGRIQELERKEGMQEKAREERKDVKRLVEYTERDVSVG